MVLGSAPYLAPEVTRGQPATEQSDIYSLGCVLYEMLTGRPPFIGELPAAVMHQHNAATPRRPGALNLAVPMPLEALVMQMLAKRPSERPPEAGKLSKALPDSLTAGMGNTVRLPREVIPPMAATRALARRRRLGRLEAIALAVALLVVLGGLASALLAPSGSSHRRAAARATVRERTGQPTNPKPTTQTSQPAPAATPHANPAPSTPVPPAPGRGPTGLVT